MTATLTDHDRDLAECLDELEADWELWLLGMFPDYTRSDFADHHRRFWSWLWSIEAGVRAESFFGIWPRGGAKSTSAEIGCVALGARRARRYGLYVCETQDQADDHVGNVGSLLESETVDEWYPWMGERLVGKFGNSKGWRRNRLRTSTGFTIDAIGLDTAARGVKLEDQRPDFLVFDDIDGTHDTPATTGRKIDTITKQILPAGSDDVVVLGIQNLVHPHSIFARIADGRADFLSRRIVSGPIPAVRGLAVERVRDEEGKPRDVIVGGDASWAGQSLEVCQAQIDDWGLRAFRTEAQHDVAAVEGALWVTAQIEAGRVDRPAWRDVWHPDPRRDRTESDLVHRTVGCDPSGGDGPENDEQGIVVVGKASDGHGYVLADRSCKLSPSGWGTRTVQAALDFRANIAVETNYGGAMARATIASAARAIGLRVVEGRDGDRIFCDGFVVYVRDVNASRGKLVRAEPIAELYGDRDRPETWQDARMHHVGTFPELEAEQTSWKPGGKSPNRIDALVWAATELRIGAGGGGLRFRGAA